jgi:C-terminal processing protease CtpA/Prc
VRIVHVEERSPAERADWRPGDLMVTVVGEPVVDAQTLQRRMFGGAIDVPLPITTFSNGAMVDVIAAVGVVTRREGV